MESLSDSLPDQLTEKSEQLRFPGRLAVQQRVLPAYRAPFFDALAAVCTGGLSVFAGQPLLEENIAVTDRLALARFVPARNWHLFSPASPFYQCWQSGLIAWLEEWQPDVLIVEANPRYRSTPSAVRWMHARRRPVIGWGLGAPLARGPLALLRQAGRNRFLRSLDGVIAYSRRGAAEYRALGFPPERVFVAVNAIAPRPDHALPQRAACYNGKPVVLFVGRLQERKRVDNLLRACAGLPADLQPRLWIVGDGPARERLEALARTVYPAAEFFGARHGSELEGFFRSADLFVLPGTGGLAVQQAMAAGLAVIVARGDGTQDDLVRPENGWQVTPDDLPSLQQTLAHALSDVARLRRMGSESYRIVREEVNLERMVAVFVEAARSVQAGVRLSG